MCECRWAGVRYYSPSSQHILVDCNHQGKTLIRFAGVTFEAAKLAQALEGSKDIDMDEEYAMAQTAPFYPAVYIPPIHAINQEKMNEVYPIATLYHNSEQSGVAWPAPREP